MHHSVLVFVMLSIKIITIVMIIITIMIMILNDSFRILCDKCFITYSFLGQEIL